MRHTEEGQRLIEERIIAEVRADAEYEHGNKSVAIAKTKAQESISKLINQIAKASIKSKHKKVDYLSVLLVLAKAGYEALYESEMK
jgi:hypothetical protein